MKLGVWSPTAPQTLYDETGIWTITWDHNEKTYVIRQNDVRVGSADKMWPKTIGVVGARDLANELRRKALMMVKSDLTPGAQLEPTGGL